MDKLQRSHFKKFLDRLKVKRIVVPLYTFISYTNSIPPPWLLSHLPSMQELKLRLHGGSVGRVVALRRKPVLSTSKGKKWPDTRKGAPGHCMWRTWNGTTKSHFKNLFPRQVLFLFSTKQLLVCTTCRNSFSFSFNSLSFPQNSLHPGLYNWDIPYEQVVHHCWFLLPRKHSQKQLI